MYRMCKIILINSSCKLHLCHLHTASYAQYNNLTTLCGIRYFILYSVIRMCQTECRFTYICARQVKYSNSVYLVINIDIPQICQQLYAHIKHCYIHGKRLWYIIVNKHWM